MLVIAVIAFLSFLVSEAGLGVVVLATLVASLFGVWLYVAFHLIGDRK